MPAQTRETPKACGNQPLALPLSSPSCICEDFLSSSSPFVLSASMWRCLYTRPRHEKTLAGICEQLGIPYYLPLVKNVRRYGNRTRESWLPLFPGYLFCCSDPEQKFRLSRHERLLSIFDIFNQEQLLQELRQIQGALEASAELQTLPYLARGKRVQITRGVFRGIVGVISEIKKRCRVLLNVTFIRESVSLEVNAEDLELLP